MAKTRFARGNKPPLVRRLSENCTGPSLVLGTAYSTQRDEPTFCL
jgi:hypothetical protein